MTTTETPLAGVFAALTARQRQAMELLSEGRTSKEIAHALGISESAAIQRIETVRNRVGGLLRKDLARAYRRYMHNAPGKEAVGGGEAVRGEAAVGPDYDAFLDIAPTGWAEEEMAACNALTGNFFQLSQARPASHPGGRNQAADELALADAIPFEIASPWSSRSEPGVVPEVLDGKGAALNRLFAATGIAVGLLVTCLVLLAVASEINRLV